MVASMRPKGDLTQNTCLSYIESIKLNYIMSQCGGKFKDIREIVKGCI